MRLGWLKCKRVGSLFRSGRRYAAFVPDADHHAADIMGQLITNPTAERSPLASPIS
jgi:hypothetical protein